MDDVAVAVAKRLKGKFQKVLIFGSRARGTARRDSDIDIIVVDDVFRGKSLLERVSLVLSHVWDIIEEHNIDFDIIALTPEEFEEKSRSSTNIVGYVLKRGEAVEA